MTTEAEFVGSASARVWDAIGRLTYAEMMEMATVLRDAADSIGIDVNGIDAWAQVIDCARENAENPDHE